MAYMTNNWLKLGPGRNSPNWPKKVEIKGYSSNYQDCIYNLRFTNLKEKKYREVDLSQDDIESILPGLLINVSEKSRIDILRGVIPNMSDEAKFGLIKLLLKDNED
jgi:hypothetical protein